MRSKQHQRDLCNEIRRLLNETIKQLAVGIETLETKAYCLKMHDYKNTHDYKTDLNFNDDSNTTTTQNCNKKESITSIINSKTDIEFQKLIDKLEQTEITMNLEERENLQLQYVINIQTTTSQINHIRDSDNTED